MIVDLCRAAQAESVATADPVSMSAERVKRLKTLVQLRKLFRNLLRAERLLATTSPVHQKPVQDPPRKGLQTRIVLQACMKFGFIQSP